MSWPVILVILKRMRTVGGGQGSLYFMHGIKCLKVPYTEPPDIAVEHTPFFHLSGPNAVKGWIATHQSPQEFVKVSERSLVAMSLRVPHFWTKQTVGRQGKNLCCYAQERLS